MTEMSTTIWSTTHTQPLTFDRISPDKIQITNEFGASQEYFVADVLNACRNEIEQENTK